MKANQKTAHQAISEHFRQAQEQGTSPTHHRKSLTLELSHGRCEKRQYTITEDLSWYDKSWKWSDLRSVAQVSREVQRSREGPLMVEEHYFLCSFGADVDRLAELVRGHWSIENRCH